jgi:tripartite-type tricarboxylate transporter receptor subunit TctC
MAGTRPIGRRGLALGVAGAVLAPSIARSQDFPSKPVHVVVPYPAGGGTDIVARLIMPRLGERWKQTVLIDNKAGASGIVGSEIVAKSPPDGYTLLVTTSAHTINPFTTKRLPYDTERDFTPITVLVSGALTLAGSTKAGFGSIQKFLAAARAEPGKYQFGSADSTTRMTGELFRVKSGLNIENVAYKGAAPMIQELVGGHIPVGFSSPLSTMAHHRAGTLRMLAVTSEKRLALLPDVPTMAEAGVPGVDRPQWFSLFGPANMPPALARRIRDDVLAVLAEPETLARIRDLASEPGGETPEVFARRVKSDLTIWRDTAKVAGIEPE